MTSVDVGMIAEPLAASKAPGRSDPRAASRFETTRFLPGLHGLRAIAALSVALFHHATRVTTPDAAWIIKSYGGFGVQLFFVLSAFSLCHSTYSRLASPEWVHEFAIKRFFRIAPMFYLGIVLFSIHDWFVWHKIYTPAEYTINFLMIFNFVPGHHGSIVWAGWTIGVEMVFYALFPVIIANISGLRSAFVFFLLCSIAASASSSLLAEIPSIPPDYSYMSFPRGLSSFSAGILGFHLACKVSRLDVRKTWIFLAGILLCPLIVFCATKLAWNANARFDLPLWGLAFAVLCVWQSLAPSALLRSRPMQFMGERSYSIYLSHAPILFNLGIAYGWIYNIPNLPLGIKYAASILVGLTCVMMVASILYAFVEVPSIRLGGRIILAQRKRAGLIPSHA